MLGIAEKGNTDREDDGCGILYGVMLDSAYKIKQIAEAEKEKHIKKGWWKQDCGHVAGYKSSMLRDLG